MVEKRKPKPEPDDPEQSKRFIDAAKQLEADETGAWFDRAIGAVKQEQVPERNRGADKSKTKER